jgi:hypothetical protein
MVMQLMTGGEVRYRRFLQSPDPDPQVTHLALHLSVLPGMTDERRYVWLMYMALYMLYDIYYLHSNR